MVNQPNGAQKFIFTFHTLVNDSVLLKMLLQINFPAGRIVTETTHLNGWNVFDIMYIQVAIPVDLFLEFSITHMTLMNDSGPPLATPLEK